MASTKVIEIPTAVGPAAPDEAVATSMENHAAAVKRSQASARRAARPVATKAMRPTRGATPKPDARVATLVAWRETATAKTPPEVLDIVDREIRRATSSPRTTVAKAEPSVVAAFFASTGLSRSQIAAAVGVSTSVIGTVQKENGDRWSVVRFEAAKPLILAAAKKAGKTK